MSGRPVLLAFDGSPLAEHALGEAAALLAPRTAVVVVVWEAGRAVELDSIPTAMLDTPPTTRDIRGAMQLDEAAMHAAEQLARRGAALARDAGFDATGIAVADEVTVPDTIGRIAREQRAAVIVVGSHSHQEIRKMLLGSTSRALVQHAPCPVLVVRDDMHSGPGRDHPARADTARAD